MSRTAEAPPMGWFDRGAARLGAAFDAGSGEPLWRTTALAVGLVAMASLILQGLRDPMLVQDDARQFLAFMGRWDDPAGFAGDLSADYWQSVSPWFYRGLFFLLHIVGLPPVLAAKLVAGALLPLTGWFVYRFVRGFSGDPAAACLAAILVVLLAGQEDIVVTATPRAFWPPLLFAVLDGLQRRSAVQTAVAQLLLAGVYPHVGLAAATVIGLTFIRWRPPGLDLSRQRLLIVGLSAVATIAGVLPFLIDSGRFGPLLTVADLSSIKTFLPGGRGVLLGPDGGMNFACDKRLGFVSWSRCAGFADPRFWIQALPLALGPVLVALRGRGRGTLLPLYLLAASLLWFGVAALLLFRLHLPSRFGATLLTPVSLAMLGALVPDGVRLLRRFVPRRAADRLLAISFAAVALAAAIAAALTDPYYFRPARPELVAAIGRLPPGTRVAGFERDLDFVPTLAQRPVLFAYELAVAYQLGYFRALQARMRDMADVELSADPLVVADRLERNAVDAYVIEAERLDRPAVPKAFLDFLPEPAPIAAASRSALAALAPACERARFGTTLLLDAGCLVRRARGS